MNPLRFIRAFFGYLSARVLPYQLQPAYIWQRIRFGSERALQGLEKRAEDLTVKKQEAPPRNWWKIIAHVFGFIVVVLGLWWLNYVLDLDKVLRPPWPAFSRYWLPTLFVLGYLLYWLGKALWRLLTPEKELSDYPDIDEAWEAGIHALKEAGITPGMTPMFLVLGRPQSSPRNLFDASHMRFTVKHIPRAGNAPLHFTAGPDAIFVTCEGASLLGRQIALLAEEEAADDEGKPDPLTHPPVLEYEDEAPDAAKPALEPEMRTLGVIMLADELPEKALKVKKKRVALLKNAEEVEKQTDRLAHLCRLMVKQRAPYCPINGLLLVLPLPATETIEDASETGAVCQHDLATIRGVLQLHCPMYVLLADMEQVPGFTELLEQFPDARQRRFVLGQPYPLMPDLDKEEMPRSVGKGVQWLFETLFPTNVYKLLRAERPGEGRGDVLRANSRLYQLLVEMRKRHRAFHHILTRSMSTGGGGPPLFGGCFLAATGADAEKEQAFVHGVFRQLIESQNYVSWTKDALEEEAEYKRWTRVGYLVILALVVSAAILGYWYWPRT